ncbi:MAG: 1-phosphofructokinase [Psychrilyobacter sp.]|uniref:1-phosphofructokinase n=1 Tax=Psychrilyobacter sp. TaxID=2586924 RepID=UPI003C778DA3
MRILTVTLNPAVDTRYQIDKLQLNGVNRVNQKTETPGGKGLNVSNVLNKLGVDIIATGLLGGSRGAFIKTKLDERGILHNFLEVKEETRTCMAIIDEDKKITEILEVGKKISQYEINDFLKKYEILLGNVDIIDISGSLPQGVPLNFYRILIEKAVNRGKKVILDTSGEPLKEGIKGNPYLIKPNIDEMEYLLGKKIENIDEIIECAKQIISHGVSNVMVTLGEDGGLLINKKSIYIGHIPKIKVENTVGSGDSSIAGFIYGLSQDLSLDKSFKYALACGTSNAMLKNTGDIVIEDVEKLITEIKIKTTTK